MQQQKIKIIESLALATEMFGKQVSDEGRKLWFGLLGEYQPDEISAAFARYFKHGEPFMPKPSDIIKLIDGTSGDAAMSAWSLVSRTVSSYGAYKSVVFPDPLIMATIRSMGGWQDLCKGTEKEFQFRANDFLKFYAGFQRRPPKDYPNKFTGIHDQNNLNNGFPEAVKPPIAIGDIEQCRLVYRGGTAESIESQSIEGPQKIQPPVLAIAKKDGGE